MNIAGRYHDFSAGHRVAGHENKCAMLHGHNYRVHFECVPQRAQHLDTIGRVIDFSGIKVLCNWLEESWDHKFLVWEDDPLMKSFALACEPGGRASDEWHMLNNSLVYLPFNPTAENMATYLGTVVAPEWLPADVLCNKIIIWETRKCYGVWMK